MAVVNLINRSILVVESCEYIDMLLNSGTEFVELNRMTGTLGEKKFSIKVRINRRNIVDFEDTEIFK